MLSLAFGLLLMAFSATPRDIELPGDRPLRVAFAQTEAREVIVYLPGMCGDERGADSLAPVLTRYGTVITVRGDVKCPDRPGYKWPHDTGAIQARIDRALAEVNGIYGGTLETTRVTLFGYSQGAHRAERVAAASPFRYPRIVLGGPPTAAWPLRLRHARRVVVLVGELENAGHMADGYLDLVESGIDARFEVLPRAGHGSFGPEGRGVVDAAFHWLFSTPRQP